MQLTHSFFTDIVMPFLTKPLFTLADFKVVMWHVLATVAVVLLLLVIIIVVAVAKRKKAKKQAALQCEPQPQTATTTRQSTVVEEQVEQDEPQTVAQDEQVEQIIEEEQPVKEAKPKATPKQTNPVAKKSESKATVKQPEPEKTVPAVEQKLRSNARYYHVSLRDDDKWQVKLSKGDKAIKLFDKQSEAINYACELARSNHGHVVIHRVNGKIRKTRY